MRVCVCVCVKYVLGGKKIMADFIFKYDTKSAIISKSNEYIESRLIKQMKEKIRKNLSLFFPSSVWWVCFQYIRLTWK